MKVKIPSAYSETNCSFAIFQIFLAAADGTGAHPLAAVPGHAFYLRWSPDGSRLRFTVRDERGQLSIWEVSARSENLHQLKFKWPGALAEGLWALLPICIAAGRGFESLGSGGKVGLAASPPF